ncbi:hypothetical protein KTAU_24080 [Thermogemmatispora aurantia]|uniref:Uncharacterized protein n=1 Tax=Thermogemmatispora aurantia TaxID=2045279 RepID=A0A5J4KAT2_9CHLR|nr:hypothetical protein KTAU_24080 [Thermogemmatispora aurantia]
MEQQRDFILHAEKDASQIDAENALPFLFWDVGQGRRSLLNTSIIESIAQLPESFDSLVQGSLDVPGPGDVALEGKGGWPVPFLPFSTRTPDPFANSLVEKGAEDTPLGITS